MDLFGCFLFFLRIDFSAGWSSTPAEAPRWCVHKWVDYFGRAGPLRFDRPLDCDEPVAACWVLPRFGMPGVEDSWEIFGAFISIPVLIKILYCDCITNISNIIICHNIMSIIDLCINLSIYTVIYIYPPPLYIYIYILYVCVMMSSFDVICLFPCWSTFYLLPPPGLDADGQIHSGPYRSR